MEWSEGPLLYKCSRRQADFIYRLVESITKCLVPNLAQPCPVAKGIKSLMLGRAGGTKRDANRSMPD